MPRRRAAAPAWRPRSARRPGLPGQSWGLYAIASLFACVRLTCTRPCRRPKEQAAAVLMQGRRAGARRASCAGCSPAHQACCPRHVAQGRRGPRGRGEQALRSHPKGPRTLDLYQTLSTPRRTGTMRAWRARSWRWRWRRPRWARARPTPSPPLAASRSRPTPSTACRARRAGRAAARAGPAPSCAYEHGRLRRWSCPDRFAPAVRLISNGRCMGCSNARASRYLVPHGKAA
jgi:hypothetical protein